MGVTWKIKFNGEKKSVCVKEIRDFEHVKKQL